MQKKLSELVKENNLNIRGIINVGSYEGDELFDYESLGIENIVSIEPFPAAMNACMAAHPAKTIFHPVVLCDYEGFFNLNLCATDLKKSSCLKSTEINMTGSMSIKASRLDRLKLNMGIYNFLSLDVNGWEMFALKGAIEALHLIDYVLVKVDNKKEYQGSATLADISAFLKQFKIELIKEYENDEYLFIKTTAVGLPSRTYATNESASESVTTSLFGLLGNQMFQIANCIAYAKRHGLEYVIPQEATDKKFPTYFSHFPKADPSTKFIPYREVGFGYEEIPDELRGVCFVGHFQSYKYFDEYRDDIIKAFSPAFAHFEQYPLEDTVSIHVRRGDYLKYPTIHPVVSEDYLAKAIKFFNEKGFRKFLVFSDDIAWCKNTISGITKTMGDLLSETTEFNYSEGEMAIKDLHTMSRCIGNIISNSTFSWWPAYFNQNKEKIVIAPSETSWFGVDRKDWDVSNLLPKEWIRFNF